MGGAGGLGSFRPDFEGNILFQDYSGQKLVSFPSSQMRSPRVVQTLNLSQNGLSGIEEEDLQRLANLRVLNLASNSLMSIPKGISSLRRLENLDISRNHLKNLTCEGGVADTDRDLVAGNGEDEVVGSQECFSAYQNLRSLNASTNELSSLLGLETLTRLESIDLSQNSLRIDAFAEEPLRQQLRSLKHLRFVDLSDNQVTQNEM